METKVLVTLRDRQDAETVRGLSCKILAEYASSILVRCDEAGLQALREAGLELAVIEELPVQVAGMSFAFTRALQAEEAAPIEPDPNRRAYYLVKLVGPPKGEWLEIIQGLGGTIQGNLPGFTLLVGLLPGNRAQLQAEPWVEGVTVYRPAMKVSPKLRSARTTRSPGVSELAELELDTEATAGREQVEVSVFPGESTAAVAAEVRQAGGMVISETPERVVAIVAPQTIAELAEDPGVQAILPHRFPEFHNDRAAAVMEAPANGTFGSLTLKGTGQVVGVADSGLDTGNPATIHADFAGRIDAIVSLPVRPELGGLITDPPGSDDGPQDINSGHGTHVAGSVLGNAAFAASMPGAPRPQGLAPEARVYFQAIEQTVNFKTAAQLIAEGVPANQIPPWWPPPSVSLWGLPDDLNDLFTPAYAAGARVHTNSWGAPSAGLYNAQARAVDEFMWNHRDMLIIFSAGNEGLDEDGDGVIDDDSIGTPGTAKNCLTVGASENNRPAGSTPAPGLDANWGALSKWPTMGAAGHVSDNIDGMAAFSSRGPTDDGRIKPDLVAPGTNVLSVRSTVFASTPSNPEPLWGDLNAADPLHGCYCWSGGTSMSTPLVAGAAALVRQHLVQNRGHVQAGVKPSGALIKAFLVNGARPMAGQFAGEILTGANNACGFGRVSVMQSLAPGALAQSLFADEPDYAVETGEIRSFEVQPVDTSQPLKITLVWTDAPGPVNIGGLQNQLYLQVVRPDSSIVNGDVTAFPVVTNNVQQVTIDAPAPGSYQIRVRGVSVTQQSPGASLDTNPRQDFALVVSNGMGFSLQPVSIAQAVDTTGSMAFFGYIEPAKERAAQLVDFMRANDKVSITEFSQRPPEPLARTPYPLRLLGNFNPDWSDAHAAIAALHANGLTPIGAGLQEAWQQLQGEPPARPRAIVLLSDGFNNQPPDPASVLPSIPNDVPIFTIALGPASNAVELQNIANSRPNGAYYAVESDEDVHKLHTIYAQVQALAAGAALVGLADAELESQAEAEHVMSVEPGVAEVTFTLSWDEKAQAKHIEFLAVGPNGEKYTTGSPATLERTGATYRILRVAAPKPGAWRLLIHNRWSERPVRYTVSGAVQSPLMLWAEAKPGLGRLALTARLLRGGKPWEKARLVARLTIPTRSRDEILAEYSDAIRQTRVPDQVLERGLSEEQILNLRLAVFARKFAGEEGGLYGRKTVEVDMAPQGDGTWAVEVPVSAAGTVDVAVVAEGEIGRVRWQRWATLATQAIAPVMPAARFRIAEIFARRNRLWRYTIIGVRVLDEDGQPGTPADGVGVTAVLARNGGRVSSGPFSYYARGRYFMWRFGAEGIGSGWATVSVQASVNGIVVDTASKSLLV